MGFCPADLFTAAAGGADQFFGKFDLRLDQPVFRQAEVVLEVLFHFPEFSGADGPFVVEQMGIAELLEGKQDFASAAKSYLQIHLMFLDPQRGPESLWRAGQCFEKASDAVNAKRAYSDLAKSYPESEQAGKANTRLSELG